MLGSGLIAVNTNRIQHFKNSHPNRQCLLICLFPQVDRGSHHDRNYSHSSLCPRCLPWHLTYNVYLVDLFKWVNELCVHLVTETSSLSDHMHMRRNYFHNPNPAS